LNAFAQKPENGVPSGNDPGRGRGGPADCAVRARQPHRPCTIQP